MADQLRKQAVDASFVFGLKMNAQEWTDARIRLAIKTLRATLLKRQQVRATKRIQKKGGKADA